MMSNEIRVFGNIERIVSVNYIGGVPVLTSFTMRLFDHDKEHWTNQTKGYDFYGPIPEKCVGHEAMYFRSNDETSTSLEIGTITPRRPGSLDGFCDIVKVNDGDPTIPHNICGRWIQKQ